MQIEAEGEIATASTLARMLSNIPLARGGPASIVIFDIHALQARVATVSCVDDSLQLWQQTVAACRSTQSNSALGCGS
jgi:hypothetical protein